MYVIFSTWRPISGSALGHDTAVRISGSARGDHDTVVLTPNPLPAYQQTNYIWIFMNYYFMVLKFTKHILWITIYEEPTVYIDSL